MERSTEVLLGVSALVLAALTAFAAYRWQQRKRARRVEAWIREFLLARYGNLPAHLTINCSDDHSWPVLVAFDDPRGGTRHRLQFACAGQPAAYSLLSEN
jgi:hypothetical protein